MPARARWDDAQGYTQSLIDREMIAPSSIPLDATTQVELRSRVVYAHLVTCSMIWSRARWPGHVLDDLVTCSMAWSRARWPGHVLDDLVTCSTI
eukprot:CAMPEP_0181247330 /NCGR_PEP_ID=MMETSP1096-20121128/44550_1 /TAXON_ID=156174 ORGANISM="Chrysochromulina ericina, Strain CCMP281" /NCGR_SAMPLE_ID=MMETSP1096 /ASSEMBLY_ACC=CAM_ASM_000453 /LENGTH=93 /DNA_ID=CAMNT_0023344367 /DNA_START=287 /DNA_END=568 /DNA_ORIENTATION=+